MNNSGLITFDSKLKELFYSKLMFIETSLKSISLNIIMEEADSSNLDDILNLLVESYKNPPHHANEDIKKRCQRNKLNLQHTIQSQLLKAYKKHNPKITHFYNNLHHVDIPIWAIFEILMLGDFGFFISCLNYKTRSKLAKCLEFDTSGDTNRVVVYKFIYILKDLRNAVAHNDVIYDTRFRKTDITSPVKVCLTHDIGLSYVNFKEIVDYIILVSYILKKMDVEITEIIAFIDTYLALLEQLKLETSDSIYTTIVHKDTLQKIISLKKYIAK